MYKANQTAASSLLQDLGEQCFIWPTVYTGLDVIANRLTPEHRDKGGANTFFDHLVNLGWDKDVQLCVKELDARFAYGPGTCILFSGKAFTHSVTACSEERVMLAHYSKEAIHHRLKVARPAMPTQLGWWTEYGQTQQPE